MTAPLPDRADRVRAATDFSRNLVVSAGAGTGKTSLLVERFLNFILSETVPLSTVAAITFTEKAAAEMTRRVEDALDSILHATVPGSDPEPPEHEAQRCLDWLRTEQGLSRDEIHRRARDRMDRLEEAFTGTIHAFSSDLLRRHPMAADVPPEFSVDEGTRQAFAFETLWADFLAEQGRAAEDDPLWDSVLGAFSEKEIEDAARSLVTAAQARDVLDRNGYAKVDAREALRPRIEALTGELAGYLPLTRSGNKVQDTIATILFLFRVFLETGVEGLQAVEADALPEPTFWDSTPGKPGTRFPVEKKDRAERQIKEAVSLLKALKRIREPAVADLLSALRPFARRFREHIGREGMLSFDDLLVLARNLLADNPEVRRAESRRFRHILVDEFQDTDPLQYEIVFLLASRETGTIADPNTTPLAPGKLFIVGDPKQSIYRFRGADIAAYLRARDHVMNGGAPASLTTNFRSRPGIVNALNPLFAGWMGPKGADEEDTEPRFEPIHAHREPVPEPCVTILSVPTEKEDRIDRRRRAEATEIARRIREWVDSGVEPKDIAVLFRSLMDSPIYTRALREAGIDFVVDGGRAFFERPEVAEAFCLLRALANPADQVATTGVLRSALGGIPDAELLAFVTAGGRLSWKRSGKPEPAAFPRIHRVFDRLREWDGLHRELPLDRWILKVLTESAFTLLMAAYVDGPQRVANVCKLAEKAATLTRDRGATLEQAVQDLEDAFTGERVEGESPLADEAVDAVRILTIHKAKGLEFPFVVLPDLARKEPNEKPETRVRTYRTRAGVFLAVDVAHRSWLRNGAAVLESLDGKRHERAEAKRVFYVATTRARERLLFVVSQAPKKDWLRALSDAWGYAYPGDDGRGGERIANGLVRVEAAPTGSPAPALSPAAAFDVVPGIRALEEAGTLARDLAKAAPFRNPSGDAHAEVLESVTETGTAPATRDVARAAGTAVHRLMETWDFRDPGPLLQAADATAAAAAAGTGADPEAVRAKMRTVLDGFLASDLPRRLARAVILGREVPMLYRDEAGATVSGYIDLLYRWEGAFHVADYKTDALSTLEQAERYRGQLTDYGEAVKRAWNLPELPVLEILFLRTGERVPLPPSPDS